MKDLVLQSIDHCQRFAPIAKRLGIEPDWGWVHYETEEDGTQLWMLEHEEDYSPYDDYELGSWRQDKLELALPEWVIGATFLTFKKILQEDYGLGKKEASHLAREFKGGRGEPKRQATVELVELLDKEGVL
jgi:hypothetical protein